MWKYQGKRQTKKQPCLASLSQTAGCKTWAWRALARSSSRAVSSGFRVHRCGHRLRATFQMGCTFLSTQLLTCPVWVGQGLTPVPIITSAHRWGAFNLDLISTCDYIKMYFPLFVLDRSWRTSAHIQYRLNLMFVKSISVLFSNTHKCTWTSQPKS